MIQQLARVRDRAGSGAPGGGGRAGGPDHRAVLLVPVPVLAALCLASSGYAAATAMITTDRAERVWALFGIGGYAVAAVAAATALGWAGARGRAGARAGARAAVLISLAGALFAPLGWLVSTRVAQPEVRVIARSAALLLRRGTPYHTVAALTAAHSVTAYDPYLPALSLFGIPRALAGGFLTDPRLWFGVAFAVTFTAALAVAGVPRPAWWAAAVTASPVVAFPLSVGGDDLPVLGLLCLGLALASRAGPGSRRWPAAAAVALGLAIAMKATAWPALPVALALVAVRQGRRAATWCGLAALGVAALADGPVIVAHPSAAVANTILFPLGLTSVASPAASALPGHLLAESGSAGHWAALILLLTAGLAVGVWLVLAPPATLQSAGWRLVLGLTLMFSLAPASRAGYFLYPFGLAALLLLARRADLPRWRPGSRSRPRWPGRPRPGWPGRSRPQVGSAVQVDDGAASPLCLR